MAHIPFHPAPGLGDLLPGTFVVPMNPITAASGAVTYVPRMGEILPAAYSLPQNPLKRSLGGCGCGGGCGDGMGELDLSAAWQSVTATAEGAWDSVRGALGGVNPWVLGGGAALLALLLFRPAGSEYRRAMSGARSRYREEVSRIRSRYPRVSGRARRAIEAF